MANAKAKSNRRSVRRSGRTKMTLTTAFMTGVGATLPKGAAGFKFTAPSKAAEALAGKPAKVKPLLQRYGEAFAKSREAGRPVSFRVDVDPDGGATVTPVEEAAEQEAFPVEDAGERSPELEAALASARERGRIRAAEILGGEDMLSAKALAERLGTSRVTVNTKRQNGQLLGLDGAKRGFRFPVWQLDAEDRPRPELPALHERLGGPWAVYRFLVQPHGELDGLTGREALERGMGKAVLSAAESIGRGDFR
jgi:DNA-binding CsgD family transcriptional regulator